MIRSGPSLIALLLAACAPAAPDNVANNVTNIDDADLTEVQDESTQGNLADESVDEASVEAGSNRN